MITKRVLRGGSWIFDARYVRCALRIASGPILRVGSCGCRPVAKALPPDSLRILRGGSWVLDARRVRCAIRDPFDPDRRDADLGLRPVAKATS
jgi:formylglycine-generating enzyme required for sulfatase activity